MKYFPAVSSSTVQYSIADNSVHHTTLKNVYYAKFHMILSLFQCENTTAKLVMLTSQTHCSAISFARFLRARKGMYLLVISSCDIKILTSGLINQVIPNFKIINIFSRDWWMFSSVFFKQATTRKWYLQCWQQEDSTCVGMTLWSASKPLWRLYWTAKELIATRFPLS